MLTKTDYLIDDLTQKISEFENETFINGSSETEPVSLISQVTSDGPDTVQNLPFPADIFPNSFHQFVICQSIQSEYLYGSIIPALSAAIGNSAVLEAMSGYKVKAIIYLAIVAPPGASKSPALKKAFSPLEYHDAKLYEEYQAKIESHNEAMSNYEKDKKQVKPQKPTFSQILIKDSTIEMVVKILSCNHMGCCLMADELSGFLNRQNQYKAGDEAQKWLEMWSGSPILLQRITRDENKVQDPFCSIVGGIQPGILQTLSKGDNEHNGFFHRFLFVYPEPQKKVEWKKNDVSFDTVEEYRYVFRELLRLREQPAVIYQLSDDADIAYGNWFNNENIRYNKATNDHVKGIVAKYQDYCLRFALILQVLYDGPNRKGLVTAENIYRAIRLTEYFLSNMNKALKILSPESPLDHLNEIHLKLYKSLPESFATKIALAEGQKLKMKDSTIKMFLKRGVEKGIFSKDNRGEYEKNF